MGYDKKLKLKFIKYFKTGERSISQIALKANIPRQTLTRWIRLYKKFGENGLENKKPGVKEKPINLETEKRGLQLWKERKRSKYSMRKDLKIKGINISNWAINKIYKKYHLVY